MTNVLALIAGGVHEAKKYLSTKVQDNKSKSLFLGSLAFFCISTALFIGYQTLKEKLKQDEIDEEIDKLKAE